MPNLTSSIKEGVCRRSFLKSVPMIAGAIISTSAVAQSLFAQTKLSHEAAKYQDNPKEGPAMFGLCPVCGASFMQGSGRSGRCERMVPALSGEARIGTLTAKVVSDLGGGIAG
jgi:hypothetical protein